MRRLLLSSSTIILIFSPAAFAGERPLNPRIDTGLKLGTERGIVTTEIWVPVRQAPDRVLYADARLTGDDRDNFEGNLGGGYRHIYGDTVLGAHGWIDRRKTARGSTFHQATLGVEALGRDIDARLNAYVPLSGSKTYATPNAGRAEPYLAGSGVFYDTTGQLVEEPQGGFDIELGARVPLFEESVDSIRVFGGFYHFGGDETPDVTGWRARVSADVTPQLQLGARFQKDAERGSQGFLEATLRFPGKASFRREGLRARLDESPERDIDIVTGAAVTDTGIGKSILDPTGNPQRVLHVDNTATGDGKGTNENPYSTLKAAEAAMKPYDVIYVREGDGGTTGQSLGIVIDKPGVSLIGSGVDLVYEGGRVTGAAAGTSTGTVLAAATVAPVITNTQASLGTTTGNGILVTADQSFISGLTVRGAQQGIRILAEGLNARIESAVVQNVTTSSNVNRGVWVLAVSGGQIGTVTLDRIIARDNIGPAGRGVQIQSDGSGSIILQAYLTNLIISGNSSIGVNALASTSGQIAAVKFTNIVSVGNGAAGVQMLAATSGKIGTADVHEVSSSGNSTYGILLSAQSGGQIEIAKLRDISSTGNSLSGIYLQGTANSSLSVQLDSITATGNTQNGVYVDDDTTGAFTADLGGGTLGSTGGNRIYGNTGTDLRVDLDGGQLKAENNWWGNGAGLLPARVTLDAGGNTVDAVPFLAADPGL